MNVMTSGEYAERTASYRDGPGTPAYASFRPGNVAACHHCKCFYEISPIPQYEQSPPHCAATEAEGLRNSRGPW